MARALLAAAGAAAAVAASVPASALFSETFDSGLGSFVVSTAADYAGSPVAVEAPASTPGHAGDPALVLKAEARRYAATAPFRAPLSLADDGGRPLVVQYEVTLQDGMSCGGSYVKLYDAAGFDAAAVTPSTPYVIMFGPDKCGATDKVHFIVRYKNPVTEVTEEHHATLPPSTRTDKSTHLYTLIVRPDDTFTIKVDDEVEKDGALGKDLEPPVAPPATVDDPADSKPADWVDDAEVPDPAAVKPDDWDEAAPMFVPDEDAKKPEGWLDDEPESSPDASAVRPEGWDDEEDGEWTAPVVPNPKCEAAPGCGAWRRPEKRNLAYKGPWAAPRVPNPAYKGPWKARQVPNPAFYAPGRLSALGGARVGGIGVEVWTMSGGVTFDNFLVARDEAEASAYAGETFFPKSRAQAKAKDEEERKTRAAEAEGKGLVERAGLALADAAKLARENPTAAVTVAATLLAVLAGGAYALFAGGAGGAPESDDDALPPRPARAAAGGRRPAPTVNAAGAEESDEEDERLAGGAAAAAAAAAAGAAAAADAPAAAKGARQRRKD